jgi:plastocyanin
LRSNRERSKEYAPDAEGSCQQETAATESTHSHEVRTVFRTRATCTTPSAGPTRRRTPGTGNTADIHNFAFTPEAVTVSPWSAVTWDFQDAIQHTVVQDDNSFSSKPLGNGQTLEHAFTAPGSVPYHCSIHPFMKGTVTVNNSRRCTPTSA